MMQASTIPEGTEDSQEFGIDASEVSKEENGDEAAARVHISHHGRNISLILAALGLTATSMVLMTYFLLSSSERIQFETAFEIFTRETAVIAEMHAENVFGQLQSLASSVRSGIAQNPQQYLHEVSVPDFDVRTEEIANLTNIELLMFAPFVPREEQRAWEEFQLLNQEWILDGYVKRGWNTSHLKAIPRQIHNYPLPEGYNDTRRGYVDTGFMEEIVANHTVAHNKTGGTSVPVAQIGPRLNDTSIVMMDLFTHPIFKKEIVASLEYDVPVISELEDLSFFLKHVQPLLSEDVDYSEPRSFTLDPVRADFGKDSITVGYVIGIIQWNAFFRDFLPADINGIVVNIESDCGKRFTYVVNGGNEDDNNLSQYNGTDKESKYQYLEQRFRFFWKNHAKGTSRHCHFDLVISPAEAFAEAYLTNAPILWAGMVLVFFVTAGVAFFLYDFYIHKQQVKISKEKARAEAVVTSLFPEHVGQKLMEELDRDDDWQADVRQRQDKPLAELFPSATIMFADIKGFTAWSSSRQPSDVFTLLETIYHEMDAIAKRRKVFKIETIGDCYVAVCGLPRPRDNHAVVMARFANDCLEKFRELVTMLDVDLPGTSKLELRTGLHSGPVTAGVLRGERARFQLFGDTVNTTARIESTGEGSRIHMSEQFANELIKFGKGHWIVPREDKVEAKGKGILTTFWLQVTASPEQSVLSGDYSETFHDEYDFSLGMPKPSRNFGSSNHTSEASHSGHDDSDRSSRTPPSTGIFEISQPSIRGSKSGETKANHDNSDDSDSWV
ncbi:Receptor-type guanylate cyclase gcy [Seminavis robusta]|uniref:Receptor-type guanylate cyclase gcy n=1 Tax=Seminavis robusta TaxID=568900 RepID=A0A9N8ED64_9STRA|nr:Receptor-type guanylate cyclase gcy [Seminavis robusta]|eukprot:Sro1004_g230130.1 Receptor-type guanylate cyclase gcy (783) ;mRNA; r:14963-18179